MLTPEQKETLLGLSAAFHADKRANRGGRAANLKRRSLFLKLLDLWRQSLENLSHAIFKRPPGRVPCLASKFFAISGRLTQVQQPGFFVPKGTPLLPRENTAEQSDSESEDSILGAPLELSELEEDIEDPTADGATPSSSAAAGAFLSPPSAERSRSPPRVRSQPELRDLVCFGRLSLKRPLPPEPPVVPRRTSQNSNRPLPPEAQVAPLTGPTAAPELSLHPTPKAAARIVLPTRKIKAKARPKPRAIVVADPASVVQCIEANLGSTLELAIGGSQVAHLLSLDYHHVLDRDYNSSVTLFRRLQSLPQVAVIILSKCSTQSLITQAGVFIQRVLAEANYSVRDVPAYYIRGSNKAQRLYQELQRTSLSFSSVLHVDDKSFITKDFDHWSRYSWCGVQLHTHRAVELYDRLEPYIADW